MNIIYNLQKIYSNDYFNRNHLLFHPMMFHRIHMHPHVVICTDRRYEALKRTGEDMKLTKQILLLKNHVRIYHLKSGVLERFGELIPGYKVV